MGYKKSKYCPESANYESPGLAALFAAYPGHGIYFRFKPERDARQAKKIVKALKARYRTA